MSAGAYGSGAYVPCTCHLGGLDTGPGDWVLSWYGLGTGRASQMHTVIDHYKPWLPFLLFRFRE